MSTLYIRKQVAIQRRTTGLETVLGVETGQLWRRSALTYNCMGSIPRNCGFRIFELQGVKAFK